MKYVYKIIPGVILFMGLAGACKDDDSTSIPGGIAVDKEEITIGPEGGTEQIAVTSYSNWVAGASKPWIFVSPANGSSSAECQLAIDSTLENTARTSQIRFALEGQEAKLITVTQFGFGKQIIVKEPDVKIESSAAYDKRLFEAVISSNVNFLIDKENIEYSFAEAETMTDEDKVEFEADKTGWITPPKDTELKLNLDRKARPRTVKAKFRWEMNTTPYTLPTRIYPKERWDVYVPLNSPCSTCRKAKYCLKKYVISSTWNPSKSKVIPTTRHVSFRWARKSVN